MKFKYIVFDLDGTLLDTLADLNAACNYALTKYNYNKVTLEETKQFIGNGIKNLIIRSLKGQTDKLELVFDEFKEYYFVNYNVYTKPYDGINSILRKLKENGARLAVVSNKNQYCLERLCEEHFNNYFEIIIGDGDKALRKPSTQGLELVAQKFNCKLEELLYIGDSGVDYETVKNAKCQGIYCAYGFRGRKSLEELGANPIVDTVDDIVKYLEV